MSYRLLSVSFISRKIYPLINNKTQRDMDVQPSKVGSICILQMSLSGKVYMSSSELHFSQQAREDYRLEKTYIVCWGEIPASEIEERLEAHD